MSESQSHPHRIRAEEDRIASRRIVAVGVSSLVLFFLASTVATRMLEWRRAELLPDGPPALPAEIGQRKIGIVEQRLFETTRTGQEWREEQLARLGSYGWVDRRAGVIRMPIDRAMELELQGVRP